MPPTPSGASLSFPGRIDKKRDPDNPTVNAIQRRLSERGCGPFALNGIFRDETEAAVSLFQSRFSDADGAPLIVEVTGGKLITIGGNTNDNGSREGVGVFKREGRKIALINKGFIDYGTT